MKLFRGKSDKSKTTSVVAWGNDAADQPLEEMKIDRRGVGEKGVSIDIQYCGVCHSDIHQARDEWHNTKYPCVPGHEIIGRVKAVGSSVSKFKEGDLVGVGVIIDSCGNCDECDDNMEQFCSESVFTYNSDDKHVGGHTFGGYSTGIVVDEDYVLSVSEDLDAASVAPLLCAGITTYSPLREWKVGKGQKVGVIGLGGLGHIGVKFAAAMGAEVVMITTSAEKGEDAKKLGADGVLLSKDKDAMAAQHKTFDFLLNTIPVRHDVNPYLMLLKRDATMCIVGAIEPIEPVHGGLLIFGRRRLSGSAIGGIKETQEMLDFCAEHKIVCDIEMIKPDQINDAIDRVVAGDVKYRFVMDIAGS